MREIPFPEPVTIEPPTGIKDNPRTVTFVEFLELVLSDPKATADFSALSKSLDIRTALREAAKTQSAVTVPVLTLGEGDWEHVCVLVRFPTNGWNPAVAYGLMPFMRAVLEARVKP